MPRGFQSQKRAFLWELLTMEIIRGFSFSEYAVGSSEMNEKLNDRQW